MLVFESGDHGRRFAHAIAAEVQPSLFEGADVFISGSGVSMPVLAKHGLRVVEDAPILNGVDLFVIAGEAAVVPHCRTGIAASRGSDFRLLPFDRPPFDVQQRFC